MPRGWAGGRGALAVVAGVAACAAPRLQPDAMEAGTAPASDGEGGGDGGLAVADAPFVRREAAAPAAAMCPTGLPRGRAPAGLARPVTAGACAAPPAAAARDTVVPDGARPAFRRCGLLGETATGIVLSPDGHKLAVLAGEGVHLIDLASWTERARIVHASEPIDAAAFSPDGARLATASKYLGQLAVWNSEDASSLRVTPADPPIGTTVGLAPGRGLAFSADGERVVTPMGTIVDVGSGATVRLGNVRDGANYDLWFLPGDQAVAARTQYHTGDSWVGMVLETFDARTGAQVTGVADQAALAADRSTAAGWRSAWANNLFVLRLHLDGTATGTMYPSGTFPALDGLLAVTNRGEALLVRVGSGIEAWSADDPRKLLARIELPPGQNVVAMSPADEVVTSGPCGTVAWDWRTGSAVWAQPFQVDHITWDSSGAIAAATGPGALWRVWRSSSGEALCTGAPASAVVARVLSADGLMAESHDDGTVELRDADLGAPRPVALPAAASGGTVAALGRGGRALAVVTGLHGPAARLVVVDTVSGAAIGALPVRYKPSFVSLSADGRRVAFQDATPALYDVVSGARLLDGGGGSLLGFDADDRRLAVARSGGSAGSGVIETYLVYDGTQVETFVVPAGVSVSRLAPDWSFAVGTPSPWSQEPMMRWALPDGPVQSISWRNFGALSFSSDGQLLFQSGTYYHEFTGDYSELAIFDLATGIELENVIDHQLAPSADGRYLFGQAGAVFCR